MIRFTLMLDRRRWLLVSLVLVGLAGCDQQDSPLPLVGTLERDRLELVAEAQERIVEVMVTEGERVQKDQPLVRLEASVYEAQLEEARAARQRAEQRHAELVRGPRRERIQEARARLDGAADKLETERREYERIQKLVDDEVLTASDLDRAFAARQVALANHDRAAADLAELLDGTTPEELGQSQAALAETEAAVRRLELIADRLLIQAPRDGIIDALPYKLGERPPAGASVVVMLADTAPYVRLYVPEPLRARVSAGLEAQVTIDGVDRIYPGTVRYVASEASFTPYYSLTQRDRSRFSYVAEITLTAEEARDLPTGLAVEVDFPSLR
ncbi:MAG: HlyD family efflux transporter periplasmic adaptor subunit [Thermoanaerobaculia bacterium]